MAWTVVPIRFGSGAADQIDAGLFNLVGVQGYEDFKVADSPQPNIASPGWLKRAVAREVARPSTSVSFASSRFLLVLQQAQQKRTWIGRHPVLFGTLVGFGGGFLSGFLPADGVFHDFTAGFAGIVWGGLGAGTGALVGGIVSAMRNMSCWRVWKPTAGFKSARKSSHRQLHHSTGGKQAGLKK